MPVLTINYEVATALDALGELLGRLTDPTPALIEIGEYAANSTRQRFRDGTAPDGKEWAGNSQVTIDIYNGMFASTGAKKPLIGETRRLFGEISWQLDGAAAVEIGSPLPYANMQQWGGTKSQWPHLWGDIPARPYLGLSESDETAILDIVYRYLAG